MIRLSDARIQEYINMYYDTPPHAEADLLKRMLDEQIERIAQAVDEMAISYQPISCNDRLKAFAAHLRENNKPENNLYHMSSAEEKVLVDTLIGATHDPEYF